MTDKRSHPRFLHLIGTRFNSLIVKELIGRVGHNKQWRCICDCGNEVIVRSYDLRKGTTKSCGCANRRESALRARTHGQSKSRLYNIWANMLDRCYNQNNKDFKYYGGRGVSVADQWRDDYITFAAYMGERPSPKHSIDRIDTNGDYEPGNVRWATPLQQSRNRRGVLGKTRPEETNTNLDLIGLA